MPPFPVVSHGGDAGSVIIRRGIVEPPFAGGGNGPRCPQQRDGGAGRQVHRAYDRSSGEFPAGVAALFAPEQSAACVAQVGGTGGEGLQVRYRAVGSDADQPGGMLQPGFNGIYVVSDGHGAPEGCVSPGKRGQGRVGNECAACLSPESVVAFPDGVEILRDRAESLLHRRLARDLPDGILHVQKWKPALEQVVLVFFQEQRFVPTGAKAGGHHESGPVMVRCEVLDRAVAPAVKVPPVPFVEGDAHIFQEIGGPRPAERCQAGLRDDGVSFREGDSGESGPPGDVGQVADQPAKRTVGQAAAELQLGGVAGFVGRQVEQPGHRVRIAGIPDRVEFHAPGSPHDHAVAIRSECMEDDGHGPAAEFGGRITDRTGDPRVLFLKAQSIGPGQGVCARRIDQPVISGADLGPAYGARIGSCGVELRPHRQRCEQKTAQSDPEASFHTTNLRKKYYL